MLKHVLKYRCLVERDQFWAINGYGDPNHCDKTRVLLLNELRHSIDAIPSPLRDRAEEFITNDAAIFHQTMETMLDRVGLQYYPVNATEFVSSLIQQIEPLTCT